MENSCIAEPGSGHYLVEKGSLFCFLIRFIAAYLVQIGCIFLGFFCSPKLLAGW